MEKTRWVQFTDKPFGLAHNAWHFVFGLSMLCDGFVAAASLGLIATNMTVRFMESEWQGRLYNHDCILFEKSVDARVQTDDFDDVKQMIATTLGIPVSQIITSEDLDPPMRPVKGPIPKKQDWN